MNSMDVEYSVTMLDNEGLSYTSTKAEQDHDLTGFQNELCIFIFRAVWIKGRYTDPIP